MSTFYNSLDFTVSGEVPSGGEMLSENHNALRKDLVQGLIHIMYC